MLPSSTGFRLSFVKIYRPRREINEYQPHLKFASPKFHAQCGISGDVDFVPNVFAVFE
jgi:hypothetical protein